MGVDEQPEGWSNAEWDTFSQRLTSALVGAMKDGDERDRPEAAETSVPPDDDVSDVDRQWRSDSADQRFPEAARGISEADPFSDLERWAPEAAGAGAPGGVTGAPPAYDDPWISHTSVPPAYDDPWAGDTGAAAAYDDPWLGDADIPITKDDEWLDDADLEPADDRWEDEDLAASLSSRMFGFTPRHGASPAPAHRQPKQRRQRTNHWHDGAPAVWWFEHRRAVGAVAAVLLIAVLVALASRGSGHRAFTAGRVAVSESTTTPTTIATDVAGTAGAAGVPASQPATTDTGVPAAGEAGLGNQGVSNSGVGGSHTGNGRTSGLAGGSTTGSTGVSPSPAGTPATTATPETTAATVPRTTTTTVPRTLPSFTLPSYTIPTNPHRTTTTTRP